MVYDMLGNRIDDLEENSGSLGLGSYIDLDNCVKVLIPSSSYVSRRIHYKHPKIIGKGYKALAFIYEENETEYPFGGNKHFQYDYFIINDWIFIEKKINYFIEKFKELGDFYNNNFLISIPNSSIAISGVWENNNFDIYFGFGTQWNGELYFSFIGGTNKVVGYYSSDIVTVNSLGYKLYGLK